MSRHWQKKPLNVSTQLPPFLTFKNARFCSFKCIHLTCDTHLFIIICKFVIFPTCMGLTAGTHSGRAGFPVASNELSVSDTARI